MEKETVDNDMMLHMNSPEILESDNIVKKASDKHFIGKS